MQIDFKTKLLVLSNNAIRDTQIFDTHMKRLTKAVFPVQDWVLILPATKAMPKELLPVIDKPLIQYAEEAISANIETLIFITGRNKLSIEDHFDRNIELENFLINQGKKRQILFAA